ncbi:MAG: Pyruvate kinase [candidate division WS6 bacterium GW2011_GWF2_39_15]|uniref:Pyruvate kinase n=1 Tax=candidate division WS6 bacterium GW2011_GWF2_39_15 TaxID=1619100 RepID=A0A0G0MSN4_9BACT|nr:MAG: Pyruvate kinase [candidate division WS6 bacterium GW2011_GWF2_39_15]
MMQKLPHTKIIATIGPSSWNEEVLKEMIENGMQMARINASFADFAELERVSTLLRKLSSRVTIMLDTKGHKIRVTGFEHERELKEGERIILIPETSAISTDNTIQITYPNLHKFVNKNTKILIDDGNLILNVVDTKAKEVHCVVKAGGILKTRKTVNVPGVHLDFPDLSQKDIDDIKYAVEHNFDYISASFIRDRNDVEAVKTVMGKTDTKLIAKIEDGEGVSNIDEIIPLVDGIMIARGDMGVELPLEEVPIKQKIIIQKCRIAGKLVIVATQMLESMKESPRPTRAEVSDVANAVMDGTDAMMLSAETSTGKYPIDAVRVMATVAKESEKVLKSQPISGRTSASEETDVLCKTVVALIEELNLKGIIVISQSGTTVRSLTRHRLKVPIWNISNNPKLIRQMDIYRGVTGIYIKQFNTDRDTMASKAAEVVYSQGLLAIDDKIAIICGSSIKRKNLNSILEIAQVKDLLE